MTPFWTARYFERWCNQQPDLKKQGMLVLKKFALQTNSLIFYWRNM